MSEQEERKRLKSQALKYIEYLKNIAEDTQSLIRINIGGVENISLIDSIFNAIETIDEGLFETGTLRQATLFTTSVLGRFAKAVRAFNKNNISKNAKSELLESAKEFDNFIKQVTAHEQDKSKKEVNNDVSLWNTLSKRLDELEKKPNELLSEMQKTLHEIDDIGVQLKDRERESKQLLEKLENKNSKFEDYIATKKDNFEKIEAQGKEILNRNISLVLSEQFVLKSENLKNEAIDKLGNFILLPKGFRGAIFLIFFINIILWIIYFYPFSIFVSKELGFWNFMMLKLTINIPLIIYTIFSLNEYSKAKKLYEEFDYKRIMATTLVNNYMRLKNEFELSEEKAFQLIQIPFEKIFDNPVHSIFGDKSNESNLNLDTFQKISSIIEKVKTK